MISRSGSMVAEQDAAVGTDDEYPWELAHVALGNAHTMPLGHGRDPPEYHSGREHGHSRGLLETKCLEKPFFRVGNHGKRDVEPFFECRRLLDTAQPDQHH